MSYFETNQLLLRQIDDDYEYIRNLFSSNFSKHPELEYTWNHFYHIWMKICEQQSFSSPFAKKRLKARVLDFIGSRMFPVKAQLARPQEASPIFSDSDLGFSFSPERMTYNSAYGFKMSSTGEDMWQILASGHYSAEYSETWLAAKLAPNTDVFIDVGANIGFFSLLLARENSKTNVFAFEPASANQKTLQENIKLNNVSESVTPLFQGLGSSKSKLPLNLCKIGSGGHTFTNVNGCETEEVDVDTLDNFIVDHKSFSGKRLLLKIDVEGFELEVLRGATNLLASAEAPIIMFEAWPESKSKYKEPHKEVNRFLWAHNYLTFGISAFKHGGRLLYPIIKNSNFTPPAGGNYLAIPDRKIQMAESLNTPVDARVFSDTARLQHILSFLKNSKHNLQKKIAKLSD